MTKRKVRWDLFVDGQLKKEATEVAKKRGTTVSTMVERYLDFLVRRPVYCFSCGKSFEASKAQVHSECGWAICPHCKACRCTLKPEQAAVAFNLRKTFEDLTVGRVGE